jgi:hypothetical protein
MRVLLVFTIYVLLQSCTAQKIASALHSRFPGNLLSGSPLAGSLTSRSLHEARESAFVVSTLEPYRHL